MKKTVTSLLFLVACLVGFTACQTKQVECASCKIKMPDQQFDVTVGLDKIPTKFWKYDEQSSYVYSQADLHDNNQLNNIITNTVALPQEAATKNVCIVLYTYQQLSQQNAIMNVDALIGYSLYYLKGEKLRHRFYLKGNDKTYKVIPELNCDTRAISINAIYDIYSLYFDGYKNVTALAVTDQEANAIPRTNKANSLYYNLRYLERKMGKNAAAKQNQGSSTKACKIPCSDKYEHDCDNTPHGQSCEYTFGDREHGQELMTTLPGQGTYTQEQIDSAFNITLQYNIRDSFMANWNIGQKYISYYYSLTPDAYLNTNILTRIVPVMYVIDDKAAKLLDLDNHRNEIFIDANFKTQLLTLLQYYKAAAPNQEQLDIFNDVEADINMYTGMTFGQFMTAIQ